MELPKLQKVDPNKPKKKKILLLSDDFRFINKENNIVWREN
jgi:hypothetical protein